MFGAKITEKFKDCVEIVVTELLLWKYEKILDCLNMGFKGNSFWFVR